MAGNKRGGSQAPVKASGDNRPNGKARKKNPGPDGVERKFISRPGRINGRSAAGHALREAWKAAGGRVDNPSIPHWKTGKVRKEAVNVSNDA